MIFRFSQKMAKKIHLSGLAACPPAAQPYWDWHVRVFTACRAHYVMITNTASLYSAVMHGRGIRNEDVFINEALSSLRMVMEADGLELLYIRLIVPETETIFFAKADDRRVIGSLNDLTYLAQTYLEEDEHESPMSVSAKLNEVPMSVLKYNHPREAYREICRIGNPEEN